MGGAAARREVAGFAGADAEPRHGTLCLVLWIPGKGVEDQDMDALNEIRASEACGGERPCSLLPIPPFRPSDPGPPLQRRRRESRNARRPPHEPPATGARAEAGPVRGAHFL
jgi:hypothetical protein